MPGVSKYAKTPEILAAKVGTICREGSPEILQKRQFLLNLGTCFLLEVYDKWAKPTLICYGCVFKMWLATNHIKRVIILALQIIGAAFHFVIWIALTEEIRVLAIDLSLSLHLMISNYYLSQPNKVLYDVRIVA